MLLDSDAPYTMHEKMLPKKFPTACNQLTNFYPLGFPKKIKFVYVRQKLLIWVNFIVLALGQDKRH
jgi:hypothetical protein